MSEVSKWLSAITGNYCLSVTVDCYIHSSDLLSVTVTCSYQFSFYLTSVYE